MAEKTDIDAFAHTISDQGVSLLRHSPEADMSELKCFDNVRRKIARDGGRARYGWLFQLKLLTEAQELEYLVAMHHAVWNGPDGSLIDPTPFPEGAANHPMTQDGSPIFLLDHGAEPMLINGSPITLPMKFYPIGEDERLLAHVRNLRREEYRRMNAIRAAAAIAPNGSIIDTLGNIIFG